MNALSRKVLQEVCSSLLITKPNVRGTIIKSRSGCLGTKRVLEWSGFPFRFHRATNEREREREREREK